MEYYFVTLSDGSTNFVSSMPGEIALSMQAYHGSATEVSRVKLDIDQARYEALCTMAHLYDMRFDNESGAITMMPKVPR